MDSKKQNILLPGLPGRLVCTHDPAHMNDLITPSATLEALQKKADIISALCIIFIVDITKHKPRSYIANWSSVNLPLQVPTRHDVLALKYLGIQNILYNTSTTQLDILSTDTQRQALWIATRGATPTTKAMVYNMFVLTRIGYAPRLTSSLKDVREKLDKPVQKPLRNLCNNVPSFPTKLLYIPNNLPGLRFKCPTDTTTTTTMTMIHRTHLQSKANTIAGMLMRPQ